MVNITRSDATTYSHVLSGLMPGVTYTVELVAVVKGVTSTPVQLNATASKYFSVCQFLFVSRTKYAHLLFLNKYTLFL